MAGFMYVYIYIRPECSGVSSNSDSGAGLTANKSPGESNSGVRERGRGGRDGASEREWGGDKVDAPRVVAMVVVGAR